ncbi:MAG: serine peptidase, partial [Pseudonocardiaceae bacterium]
PLGMPDVVFDRLDPLPNGRGARPPGVTRWVNLADPGDLIAIPRPLTRRFNKIDADHESSIHAFDFHRVDHYLACPATRAQLAPYMP